MPWSSGLFFIRSSGREPIKEDPKFCFLNALCHIRVSNSRSCATMVLSGRAPWRMDMSHDLYIMDYGAGRTDISRNHWEEWRPLPCFPLQCYCCCHELARSEISRRACFEIVLVDDTCIAGGRNYAFLMLGAVIGMWIFIQYAITSKAKRATLKDHQRADHDQWDHIAGRTCDGKYGTYLGGVWANESWEILGLDAKETWALVTILVYAFILHMRFIPGLQSAFAFDIASLFGFATVIMTTLGNYTSPFAFLRSGRPGSDPISGLLYRDLPHHSKRCGIYHYRRVYSCEKINMYSILSLL